MARRTLSGFLAALVVAMMVGMREAVGIAPPPPTLSTEETHWLSPELEHDLDANIEFVDAPGEEFEPAVHPSSQPRRRSVLRRLFSRFMG